jgi:hypothetical protein
MADGLGLVPPGWTLTALPLFIWMGGVRLAPG